MGKQCSLDNCRTLDFLPIPCSHCSLHFCRAHSLPAAHSCSSPPAAPEYRPEGAPRRYPCTVGGCNRAEPAPVQCAACQALLCLVHRHQADHSCSALEAVSRPMAATKEVVKEILSSGPAPAPARPPRTVKAQKTAAKVQLMKLKMGSKAGDPGLPQEERVYFLVSPPRELARPAAGAWVSRAWSMGRVLDSLAAGLGVTNRNNVSGAEKLGLYRSCDGQSLSREAASLLRELLEREEVFNGDSVLLEFCREQEASVAVTATR